MVKIFKDKKGFTLIEVIAVVVIIGLLAGISIPLVSKYLNDGKDKYNNELVNDFSTIVKSYYSQNPGYVPRGKDEKDFGDAVWLTELQNNNYLSDELVDAEGGSCSESVGYAIYDGNNVNYGVCLKCENYHNYDVDSVTDICNNLSTLNECNNSGTLSVISKKLYRSVDGVEYVYSGDWTKDDVTLEIITDKPGSLSYNGKTYIGSLDTSSGANRYVYNIVFDETITDTAEIYLYDRCNNITDVSVADLKIDKSKPTLNISAVGDTDYVIELDSETKQPSPVTVKHEVLNVSDFGSGISSLTYQYCNGDVCSSESVLNTAGGEISYSVSDSGNYYLKVVAIDAVGNRLIATHEFAVKNRITFNLDGGTGNGFVSIDKDFNVSVNIYDSVPEKSGYVFDQWLGSDGDDYAKGSIYNKNSSIELKAQWISAGVEDQSKWVNVTFHCPEGDVTKKYVYGLNERFISCSSKTGYNQTGWSFTSGGVKNYNSNILVQDYWIEARNGQTIHLYSTWAPKTVIVTFYCSATNKPTQTFTYGVSGQSFDKKNSCSKTGYNQTGWRLGSDTTVRYSVTSNVSDSWINWNSPSVTIYPTWSVKTVNVKFYCSSTDIKTQTFTYGVSGQKFSKVCSKTGYNQTGWSLTSGGDRFYNIASNVSDYWINNNSPSVTIYPTWSAKTVNVKFYCSSSDIKTQTFTYGKSGQSFSQTCSKAGLVLKGWSLTSGGDRLYSVANNVIDSWINKYSPEIVLYPVWHLASGTTSTCSTDKVKPVCELLTSCYSVSGGMRAKFRCKDASSKVTIYSVFAETGWQEARFNSADKIKQNMTSKGTANAGIWLTKDTTWSTSTTPSNPPTYGKQYTFYFGAVDACGNRIVIDNVTSNCKYNIK